MLIIYITIKIFDYYFHVLSKTGKIPSLTSIFRVVYSTETLSENKCDMIPHDTLIDRREIVSFRSSSPSLQKENLGWSYVT